MSQLALPVGTDFLVVRITVIDYEKYYKNIRQEYIHVEESVYIQRRSEVGNKSLLSYWVLLFVHIFRFYLNSCHQERFSAPSNFFVYLKKLHVSI